MLNTRLIFVEGIPGSGKSNAAAYISEQLQRNGIPALEIDEKDPDHPTRMDWNMEAFDSGESLEKWKAFAASRRDTDEVVVFEGQLFHRNASDLFFGDVPVEEIEAHIHRVIETTRSLNPMVIYLTQEDLAGFMRKVCDRRGTFWEQLQIDTKITGRARAQRHGWDGFPGLVKLYTAFRAMTDRLVRDLEIPFYEADISEGKWSDCYAHILSFISPAIKERDISYNDLAAARGDLTFFRCADLRHTSGCEDISRVARDVKIRYNPDLIDLDGLQVETVGRDVYILSNPSLEHVEGLSRIRSIPRNLRIHGHAGLTTVEGLRNLESVAGRVKLIKNSALRNLEGLRGLRYVGKGIDITANHTIETLEGLDHLTQNDGFLIIKDNESLQSLDGLTGLSRIDRHLEIRNNPDLTSLQGLRNLVHVGGRITIRDNPLLDEDEIKELLSRIRA